MFFIAVLEPIASDADRRLRPLWWCYGQAIRMPVVGRAAIALGTRLLDRRD